ncbi:hypothetical protein D770_10355 [Flammeovirgaceae bacterium 311]|nr:hypothetical protein D770_10355 [Flammeovirgaceae bacterium 311]
MSRYEKYSQNPRRLQGFDYRSEGLYFITICTKDRLPYFGKVESGEMILSVEGQVVQDCWTRISDHFPKVFLGEFVVMPNHMHGLIGIERSEPSLHHVDACIDATEAAADKNRLMAHRSPKAGSVSRIIGSFKSASTNKIRALGTTDFNWQPRFHDRITRNQQELEKIENYIITNPIKWTDDRFHI